MSESCQTVTKWGNKFLARNYTRRIYATPFARWSSLTMVPVSSSYQVHSMRICPFFFVLFVLEMCMTTWLHLMWFVSVVGGRGRCWCDELSETERRLCEVEGKDSVPCGGQQLIDGISCPSIPLARPLSPPSPPVTGLAWLNGYGSPWWWSLLKNYCTRPCFVSSTQGLEK